MHAILFHHDLRATGDVVVSEIGNIPRANDAFWCDERRTGVDDGRSTVRAPKRERHRSICGEEAAAVLVQRIGHLELAAGELVIVESRTLLEKQDAHTVAR